MQHSSYNITVLNSDSAEQNITQVNVTFPSSFRFWRLSNYTSRETSFFENTSTVLSWKNSTGLILGGGTTISFRFNMSQDTPGAYVFSVRTLNESGTFDQNFTVNINDTTLPTPVNFSTLTTVNNTVLSASASWVSINVTAIDNGVLDRFLILIYNSSGVVNESLSKSFADGSDSFFINFSLSGLADGIYTFNASVNDTFGNTNYTKTRQVLFDATPPVPSFASPTPNNNAQQKLNNTFPINVSYTEINPDTIIINLYNSTGLVNRSVVVNPAGANNGSYFVNFTGAELPDGALPNTVYYVNATINDSAGNVNNTETRQYVIDTVLSVPSLVSPTPANNTAQKFNTLTINVSYNELNPNTVSIRLFNTTSLVNLSFMVNPTGANNGSYTINFTGLPNSYYYVNATVNDSAGNVNNNTETRQYLIDTVLSVPSFASPTPNNSTIQKPANIPVNITFTEINPNTVTINLFNTTGLVNVSFVVSPVGANNGSYFINFTGLTDTTYYVNATVNDSAGNVNNTQTRQYSVDTVFLAPSFATPSPANNTAQKFTTLAINVTFTEPNPQTISIRLFNTTSLVNLSFRTSPAVNGSYTINFTGLSDSYYYVNATVNDSVGNVNNTETRQYIIDTVLPVPSFASPIFTNGTFQKINKTSANVTFTENNPGTITINLYNTTGLVNQSFYYTGGNNGSFFVNYTFLNQTTYYVNATINDSAGNINNTETRILFVDSTNPLISSVSTETSHSTATIMWTTNENANSTVKYGLDLSLGSNADNATSETSHSVRITSLSALTTYYYNITSCDGAANCNATTSGTFDTSDAPGPSKTGNGGSSGTISPVENVTQPPVVAPIMTTPAVAKQEPLKVPETGKVASGEKVVPPTTIPVVKGTLVSDIAKGISFIVMSIINFFKNLFGK